MMIPFILWGNGLHAQSDPTGESPVTRTFAITNATIVTAPGKTQDDASILFENGLIGSIGSNIKIPDNAEVIDGTGLYVYPGFIDGMAYTGAVRPEAPKRPDNLFAPAPPDEFAGITPGNQVAGQLDPGESTLKAMRKNGFTISHTVPYGRMLPGSGALITLIDTDNKYNLLLSRDVSLYSQFVGAPGAYPSNTLGIMAKFRNLYRNAEYSRQHNELYASNAKGLPRPIHDPAVEAFFPVISKEKPIFFNASNVLDAQRAIRLQKELGFSLVLGNLKEGWDITDAIKAADAKVFLSLDLPKKPASLNENNLTEEAGHMQDRRLEFWNKYITQAQVLEKAGIRYGFSTMGAAPDKVRENIRVLIENGLSEEAALAALTVNAAEILNISHIAGSLETGKLANAIITDGPVFGKETAIKYVFADGDKFYFEKSDTQAAKSENAASVAGTWSFNAASPEGEQQGTLEIINEDGILSGTLSGMPGMPPAALKNMLLADGILSFNFTIDGGGQLLTINVSGNVDRSQYNAEAYIADLNINFPLRATKDGRI